MKRKILLFLASVTLMFSSYFMYLAITYNPEIPNEPSEEVKQKINEEHMRLINEINDITEEYNETLRLRDLWNRGKLWKA